ncbi:MAG: CocE/NonD family hydrolase [Eubacteriales bacterium]|jgi:putative CocE/NonD family hydrolase
MTRLKHTGYWEYLDTYGTQLFTAVLLPDAQGTFPTVVYRSPYVDALETLSEETVVARYLSEHAAWLNSGYAVVMQHCRGRGKSGGVCVPYINERADGLRLLDWIRTLPGYNGELYLVGGSYLSSVHYAVAPFAGDIRGAVFKIQDDERYNICYRNGFFKSALHGSWYMGMYHAGQHPVRHFTPAAFDTLPLSILTRTVFGEPAEDFDEMLRHPDRRDAFWNTLPGGSDSRNAVEHADIPILLTTGFYDIYTGGIFDMWRKMKPGTRARSALVVSPYDHGDGCPEGSIRFPNGKKAEQFGDSFEQQWLDYTRGIGEPPFPLGKVTYYRLFENRWASDAFDESDVPGGKQHMLELPIGSGIRTYVYNPYDPPRFRGGLSGSFGGADFQDPPNSRHDIVSLYTEQFDRDVFIKGRMSAALDVASDCEDTCFYMRISIEKTQGDFGLRDDILSLCGHLGDYTPGSRVRVGFTFDDHAFLVRRGERLRIDIASADNAHFVRHTNRRGLFSEQTSCAIAHNTLYLDSARLTLPIE